MTTSLKQVRGDESVNLCPSLDETDWIHEFVRLNLELLADNIHVNDELLGHIKASYILDEEEQIKVKAIPTAQNLLTVLLSKEEPSVWKIFVDKLLKTKPIHRYVVEQIQTGVKKIKEDPFKVINTVKRRKTNEMYQNSAKLASLFLHIVQTVLLGRFCKTMENRYGSLKQAYDSKQFRYLVIDHVDGVNNCMKLLKEEQYIEIKESNFEMTKLKELNVSLLITLIEIFNHSMSSKEKQAFVELKEIRDTIFLDIIAKGTTHLRFEVLVKKIIQIITLFEYKGDINQEISVLKTQKFEWHKIDDLKRRLMVSVDNDLLSTRDLIEKHGLVLASHYKLPCIPTWTLKSVHTIGDIVEMQKYLPPEFRKEIIFLRTKTEICTKLEEIERNQASLFRNLKEAIEASAQTAHETSTDIKKIKAMIQDHQKSHNLAVLQELLQQQETSFKILIINEPLCSVDEVKQIAYVLGCCPWNIIIDLDYRSRVKGHGMHDFMVDILRKQKLYKVITYKETKIDDTAEKAVAKGEKCLWLLANGCEQTGCEKAEEKFGKVSTKLPALFEGIFEHISNHTTMMTFFLRLGESCLEPMNKIHSILSDVKQSIEEKEIINYRDSIIISLAVQPAKPLSKEDGEMQVYCFEASVSQIITALAQIYAEKTLEKRICFPGENGSCSIGNEELVEMETLMVLFHEDIGKIQLDEKNDNEIKEILDSHRIKFLRGGEITPEDFYLHKQYGNMYAQRSEMEEAKRMVDKELERRDIDDPTLSQKHRHCTIEHDSSGGGSTVARYVLYKLKDRYPCVLLAHTYSERTISVLSELFRKSGKPLLVVIDNKDISVSQVVAFQNDLNNGIGNKNKCVVVHVHHIYQVGGSRKGKEQNLTVYVTSTVKMKSENHTKFSMLYKQIKKSIKDIEKVYLFGLLTFTETYERRAELVKQCLSNATKQQIQVLRIVCGVRRFCHFEINIRLFWYIIRQSPKPKDPKSDFVEVLGQASNILIFSNDGLVVRPAQQCVIEPFFEELEKLSTKADILKEFVKDLEFLMKNEFTNNRALGELCRTLFIYRQNPIEEYYSPLLISLEHHCGPNYVSEQLQLFLTLLSGSDLEHFRAVYAKYLLYKMGQTEESIQEMKTAVGIVSGSIHDSNPTRDEYLLTMYGYLYRTVTNKRFQENIVHMTVNEAINHAYVHAQESVYAFELAQQIQTTRGRDGKVRDKFSPTSYLGEAVVRSLLLGLIFKHLCNERTASFQLYMETTENVFIKECEKRALEALDKIELLAAVGKLYDDNQQETNKRIMDCKIKLFKCRGDFMDIASALRGLSDDACCDLGYIVALAEGKGDEPANLEDIHPRTLKLLHDKIEKKRVKNPSLLLTCNFRDMLIIMILLAQSREQGNYNIPVALEWTKLWKTQYKDDVYADYMQGLLFLAAAIENNNSELIVDSKMCFEKCSQFGKTRKALRIFKFLIGTKNGLEKLVSYSEDIGQGKLHSFTGRIVSQSLVTVEPFERILKAKLESFE